MKEIKLFVTAFVLSLSLLNCGYADNSYPMEGTSMKPIGPDGTEMIDYVDDTDEDDVSMSAGETGISGYNMEESSSASSRNGYGTGMSANSDEY